MPTPSDNTPQLSTTSLVNDISSHTTCPPEIERLPLRSDSPDPSAIAERDAVVNHDPPPAHTTAHSMLMRSEDAATTDPMRVDSGSGASGSAVMKATTKSEEESGVGRLSPAGEPSCSVQQPSSVANSPSVASLLSYEFSNVRLLPNYTSSFLRPGSKFTGTQQSDRQVYNVDVEIKHVDMAESYLCGYLRIQGLTEDHPTLTTFFEGEIIGTKHTFKTRHEAWGATEKTDMNHWARFPAWRPLARQAKKPDFTYRNFAQREHIFMRWKEYFLVPDHRVRTISGASFEGFYYICFNQIEGTVTGIYFHAKSEKYQQLELKHVEDRGCTPAFEFR
ncbi:GID4/VID24 family protein [Aspergillus ruber CBS 135680]|uniref:Putative vesicle-mediated transport protein Vid24 n=1 Tax=Aspergillus ruber (strain CBS 135680) TaxID=1388766 RepID=A0A017SF93_ASPRC|nr:putative vesicle-mediated transport protein Vid24 [Aspergillus ruber CBS 135680]EYE95314.1 putative vesicle-mediated transport protein Vid24 [Aspergillus ruber CBS 135680]